MVSSCRTHTKREAWPACLTEPYTCKQASVYIPLYCSKGHLSFMWVTHTILSGIAMAARNSSGLWLLSGKSNKHYIYNDLCWNEWVTCESFQQTKPCYPAHEKQSQSCTLKVHMLTVHIHIKSLKLISTIHFGLVWFHQYSQACLQKAQHGISDLL